ncbi:MAG: contractile injection system tape measure protein [Lentimicrobium sp.]|jgi:hypothetical protein|nr:contractile injection system tape measure protein [Lentimicrobium sp.]
MTHHIRQQFLEVAYTGSTEDGMALQGRLSGLYYDQLLPAIEKAFDRALPADRLIVIDRLEIDAGTIAFDRLDKDFPETLLRELANIIHQKGYDRILSGTTELHDGVAIKTIPEHLADVFIHFLKTGTLLWSFRLTDGKTLEDELMAVVRDWKNGPKARTIAQKIVLALAVTNAVKRLSNEFSVNFKKQLLRFLSAEIADAVDEIQKSRPEKGIDPDIEKPFTNHLFEIAFTYLAENKRPSASGFESEFIGKPGKEPSLEEVISKRQNETEGLQIQEPSSEKPETINQSEIEAESFYIDNAGLILLHPFLPRYFETLGLVKDKKLISPDRALNLLNYLATGNTSSPEYELVLPKILCGLPLFVSGESKKEISENELQESLALLNAVIRHWAALRNTSVDGLREAFLQRPGKLSQKEDGDWLLQLESRTHDILLGQLPWGFNRIQLPWMERMLWVEWSY